MSLVLLLQGCYWAPQAAKPMPAVHHRLCRASKPAQVLLVFLPGHSDVPQDFVEQGFIKAIKSSGLAVDAIMTDAHLGYYKSRTLVPRLRQDIILPARKRYQRIWLVGFSMGGFGAAMYAKQHPHTIEGALLVAPYLGPPDLIESITAAGGLGGWTPAPSPDPRDLWQQELWSWLKSYSSPRRDQPKLFLGYGDRDRLAKANSLLASVLPQERVFKVSGGHQWAPWREIFRAFLKTLAATGYLSG